jgi:hypothetical protein
VRQDGQLIPAECLLREDIDDRELVFPASSADDDVGFDARAQGQARNADRRADGIRMGEELAYAALTAAKSAMSAKYSPTRKTSASVFPTDARIVMMLVNTWRA